MPEYLKATIQVRGRPVGVIEDDRYTSVIAMERGYFPVSHTGYRSLTGLRPEAVTLELLEALAVQQDRERTAILWEATGRMEIAGQPLYNYVRASQLAHNAVDYGFFARPAERQVLWPAAHRLYRLILCDRQFQPVPDERWEQAHCAHAMEKTRMALELLEACCRGDFPAEPQAQFLSARGYARLPLGGVEPVIDLGGDQLDWFAAAERPVLKPRVA